MAGTTVAVPMGWVYFPSTSKQDPISPLNSYIWPLSEMPPSLEDGLLPHKYTRRPVSYLIPQPNEVDKSRLIITRLTFTVHHLSFVCNYGKMHTACHLLSSIFKCRLPCSKHSTLCLITMLTIKNFLIFREETLCPAHSHIFIFISMNLNLGISQK